MAYYVVTSHQVPSTPVSVEYQQDWPVINQDRW